MGADCNVDWFGHEEPKKPKVAAVCGPDFKLNSSSFLLLTMMHEGKKSLIDYIAQNRPWTYMLQEDSCSAPLRRGIELVNELGGEFKLLLHPSRIGVVVDMGDAERLMMLKLSIDMQEFGEELFACY